MDAVCNLGHKEMVTLHSVAVADKWLSARSWKPTISELF